jgi:aryl-alcohol dehydrogenase-like predicted oxidoreductase
MLGLGTATLLAGYGLGAAGSTVDGDALITRAITGGVRYIDTAAAYGDSERQLGRLSQAITASRVRVATKVTGAQLLAGEFEQSLARLGVDRIDTLLLHSAASGEVLDRRCGDAMTELKARGVITRAGASTYGEAAATAALAQPWCDAVQVEFSILNPGVVAALAATRQPRQEIVVRSVLCKGLLTDRRRLSAVPASAHTLLDELDQVAHAWAMTLPQLAVRFALDTPGIDVVLVGASNTAELDAALDASALPRLTPQQISELARFNRAGESWTHPEQWVTA